MIDTYLFVSFYEYEKKCKSVLDKSEKEIKVYSTRQNEWLNNMPLCSKCMELTYVK
jgi:hypothetical protein